VIGRKKSWSLTGKYREFHKLYNDEDFYAAASLLLSLLDSKLAPKE
jgi:nuclear pore complex protein Nup85